MSFLIKDKLKETLEKNSTPKYHTLNALNNKIKKDKERLKIFIDLDVGCKIGKENGVDSDYQLYFPAYYQKIVRWYYNEDRNKTIEYLKYDFDKFAQNLDEYLDKIEYDPANIYEKSTKKLNIFIKGIITGLYNLKTTYKDYREMQATVDSIILTLLDFKNKSEDILIKNKENMKNNPILRLLTRTNSFN